MNMEEVVIMARVSSDEQAKGYSLDVQKDALTKYCITNNLTISHVIKEDHSAKSFNRPAFKEFLSLAKKNKGKFSQILFTSWDRFSRNATQAFAMIETLKQMGISCNAIEQPLDMKVPENKLILSVYLTIPEIDNDRRSIKIKGGMRGALKAGRWCRKAPIGFNNSRDIHNKPIIVSNEDANVIVKAFTMVSTGFSQAEVLREVNQTSKKLTKSNISLILRNPVYMGKIIVPRLENEPEVWVEGVHNGIVSESLFNKVQAILNKKSVGKHNKIKEWNELPLRGKLECTQCGKTLTGSGSRSRNGNRYFYYHCEDGCKERHSANSVNEKIEKLISLVEVPIEYAELLKVTIRSIIEKDEGANKQDKNALQKRLTILKEQEDNLDESFLSNRIDSEKYNRLSEKIKVEIINVQDQLSSIKIDNREIDNLIENGVQALQNFSKTYKTVDIYEKRRMLGSMFPEKIQIFNDRPRTARLNSAIELILLNNKGLLGQKKGQIRNKSNLSSLVVPVGIEPTTQGFSVLCSTN
jgi:site-specific DNA recombinase